MKKIKQTVKFKASPHKVYEAIMDEKKHEAFTGAPCKMSRDVGGKFSCYGDYIKGKNVELVKDKKIVQRWIGEDFPKGAESIVTFELKDGKKGETVLKFTHENIPDKLAEHIDKGWKEHYWDKMQEFFESDYEDKF